LKYSPAETFIDLKITNDSGSTVIEVMDRGGGLPKGQEEQIFKPFFRAPGLVESSIPGVGIGLALCRGLVDANGGTLSGVNREGGGAVFRVTLPWRNGTEALPKADS
jgi:two-component system, OmpR family, sensor histidine kinase KdpD